ncbi:MAG TPA: riboflavin synthase [Thermoanaerobaculaceae bacterium]|nr:riboflavin synthase [Thermoanaerobaculaceae bacterium]
MFSGLVSAVGEVRALRRRGTGASVEVRCALPGEPLAAGESVAVQGVCLTVVTANPDGFSADLSPETLARTTLGSLRPGAKVNLERSLRLDDRLGGHIVLGHVDATTTVVAARPGDGFQTVRFALPSAVAGEVAMKGSVAVDGVSLTVAALGEGWFEVALIPTTVTATTLGNARPGDRVNLETDVLAKYVRRALAGRRPDLGALLSGLSDETG